MSLVEIFLLLFLLLSLPSYYSLLHLLERGVLTLEKMAASSEKASVVAEAMGGVLKSLPPSLPSVPEPLSPLAVRFEINPSIPIVLPVPPIPPGLDGVILDYIKEDKTVQIGESIKVTNAVLLDLREKLEDSAPEHVLRFLKEAPQVDRSIASLWLKSWGGGYVLAWLPTKQESPDDVPSC